MEKQIGYRIVRSRRKTIAIRIERDGSVTVRAPLGITDETILSFVRRHEEWIARHRETRKQVSVDLADGRRIALFGSEYTVCTGKTRIDGQTIFLPQTGREEAFVRLLKRFAAEVAFVLTNRIAKAYGFSFRSVRISSARGRWGSCNRDHVIAYSFRVAFLPPELCEYVIVHELCHTIHFNHSAAFWKTVECVLPDWRERKKALKEYASVMNVL